MFASKEFSISVKGEFVKQTLAECNNIDKHIKAPLITIENKR